MKELKMFADKLTKSASYRDIPEELINEAKEKGIVIVYGASDDLLELEGAIRDEFDCYEGGICYINKEGLINSDCEDCKCCKHFQKTLNDSKSITSLWCKSEWTWSYKTDIPHEKFYILDGDEQYCEGLVFYIESL